MVLSWLAGAALGTAGGVALGCQVVPKFLVIEPKDYITAVDISADNDPNIPMPKTAGKPVSVFKKRLLKDTSPWLVQPDYDRVLFINTILETLWPHLSPAIHKVVMEGAKVPLQDVCKKAKVLQEIRIDRLDLGTRPPRVDCFKSYETAEDELIVEAPSFWGGDVHIRVTAVVKAGSRTIDVPVDVKNVQFKALARITVKPLVETLPCFGGVAVSLLETPHFDMDLRIGESWDIMALPGLPLLVSTAIKVVAGQMLVYPNEFSLPIMPNFGLPPPPCGMLHVKVINAKGLKGSLMDRMDAFVLLEVRKGRPLKTKVIPNNENPVWNEEFDFVVDTPKEQGLSLVMKDDDLLGASTEGVAVVPLEGAEFLAKPRVPVTLTLPLHAPGETGKAKERHHTHTTESGVSATGSHPSPSGDSATSGTGEKKKNFLRKGMAKLRRHKKPTETPGEAAEQAMADAVGGTLSGDGADQHHHEGGHAEDEDGEGSLASTPRVKLPSGAPTGATVTIECTYFPFKFSQPEPITTSTPGTSKDAQEAPTAAITSVRRMLMSTAAPDLASKGVLTVFLKKCTNLANNPDTYAVITLYDPFRLPIPNIEFRSEVVMNEDCPRFNLHCDFVNVSVASSLSVTIHEKSGTLDALKSFKLPFLQKAEDKVVGRMRITLEDVAKEGRIKDQWPLLEAQTGEVHMGLEWNPIVVEQAAATTVA